MIGEDARKHFWSNLESIDILVDIELDLASSLKEKVDWRGVICSQHELTGVPANLIQLYDQMMATGARVVKIAVQASDVTDCLPVFQLLERAQRDQREIIAIAMGEAGIASRILGPSRGAFLTFGSLDQDSATASGQPTAQELREIYRIDQITRQTMITGLVGLPVAHSFSPAIHNAAFKFSSLDGVYLPFAVHDFAQFMRRMVRPATREIDWRLRGLSITAPHKSSAISWLDWMEPSVREIGAVNTIVIENNTLRGYNTDAAAFIKPLARRGPVNGLRCAVLGAGGAAKTAAWALKREGAIVTVVARNHERATELSNDLGVTSSEWAEASYADFDVVVNATPLGTAGPLESQNIVTADQLRGAGLAYDLVYNPVETQFLREAASAGCETIGGLEMLIGQAAAQYELWTGAEAPLAAMNAAAQMALARLSVNR